MRGGRYYVEDMNSTNGTLLNDASLSGEAELVAGDWSGSATPSSASSLE